ncbi:MAG TPA: response regulator [Flavisolibacter sp.]|nr:response regulator [Flavisolibacter sp.]
MKSRYIIFADDDADDLELITGFFKQYNREVNVLEFKDGKEVLKFLDDFALNASAPILIILDINMPRMNGKETLMAIRNHTSYQHIPVMLYSTSNNKADHLFCQQFNASWIIKPSNIDGVKQVAKIIADFCRV